MYYYVYYLKCKSKEIIPEEFIHDFIPPIKLNLEKYNVFWSPKTGETPGNYMVKCGELPPFVEKEGRLRSDIGKIAGYYSAWILNSAETKYELELKIAESGKVTSNENIIDEGEDLVTSIAPVAEPAIDNTDVFEVTEESDNEKEELKKVALKSGASAPRSKLASLLKDPRHKTPKPKENGYYGPFGPVNNEAEEGKTEGSESSGDLISDDEPQCTSCYILTKKNLELRLENQRYKTELCNLREKNKEYMDKLNEIQKDIKRISIHFS